MTSSAEDCTGTRSCHCQSSADIRAALLGRPLTAVERAADDYSDWLRERDAAELAAFLAERQQHAAWRAQQPPRMWVNVNSNPFPKLPAQTDAERRAANWRNERPEAAE
jgi:hypothetical protein